VRLALLRGWTHSGFNAHRSQRVPPRNREDPPSRFSRSGGTSMERLAQYIIRNPFSVDKMQPNSSGDSIIYRSGMNPKIQRNFEVFSPCDFIARITQHIPDKSFQIVRYYGWYSNKMRGQRLKQTDAEPVDVPAGEVIDVSAFKPRRIPSKKWRELIKKVWEADPLLCPQCHKEMRIITLIDEAAVIERILRHLGLWEAGVRVDTARDPPEPVESVIEPWLDDPFPDYDHEPVFAEN
jgi:hypothetical protein